MLGGSRAQIWAYAPRYRRPRHFHAEPELNLVVRGRAVFGLGERWLTVQAGEFLTFAPGQDHVLQWGSKDLVLFAVGLRKDYLAKTVGDASLALSQPVRLETRQFEAIVRLAERNAEQASEEAHVAELWDTVNVAFRRVEPQLVRHHVVTRRALAALSKDPGLDRSDLAKVLSFCPTELSRHFHADMGMTLVQYRTRLRLLDVIQSVDDRSLNLTAASVAAGFGSYSQCHRQFTKVLGVAPQLFFRHDYRARLEQAFCPLEPSAGLPTRDC